MSLIVLSNVAIADLVVDAMELLYCAHELRSSPARRSPQSAVDDTSVVRGELAAASGGCQPARSAALEQLVWQLSVRLRRPTIWCLQKQLPTSAAIGLVCRIACVNTANLLTPSLTDNDFDRLTISVGLLATAKLLICRIISLHDFQAVLVEASLRCNRPTLVCDWPLSRAEVCAAMRTGVRVISARSLRRKSTRFR